MKRFFISVAVTPAEAAFGIELDGRPVRTPRRAALHLPTRRLADAIAAEWQAQGDTIDPHAMPLTGFANAAIDHVAPEPAAFAETLARYAASDLLCYRADAPADLVQRQAVTWDPPLRAIEARLGARFLLSEGIRFVSQPRETLSRVRHAFEALTPWQLAPLQPIVTITGSAILALALLEGSLGPDAAFAAGQLDELYQVEKWGDDEIALEARKSRRVAFDAAANFLRLAD